jgi:hypothetical protein
VSSSQGHVSSLESGRRPRPQMVLQSLPGLLENLGRLGGPPGKSLPGLAQRGGEIGGSRAMERSRHDRR